MDRMDKDLTYRHIVLHDLLEKGRYDEALDLGIVLISLNQYESGVLKDCARAALKLGKIEIIEELMLYNHRQGDNDVPALYRMGLTFELTGKPWEALSYYNQVLALDENHWPSLERVLEIVNHARLEANAIKPDLGQSKSSR